ncbi:hypothetical protein LB503_008458, partial [Fusarium chuoi]
QRNINASAYFHLEHLAGLDHYRPLLSQRNDDLCQVEHGLTRCKQQRERARQKRDRFWPITIFCTIVILAPFFLVFPVVFSNALYTYETTQLTFCDRLFRLRDSTYNAALWSTELSHLVSPVMCHSHNDYWRPHPLFSALSVGCASVEADV